MSVRLDRFQLSVVDSPQNASLCVAACPGSGKSTTLACRARKLLADGVPPAQLIVLTFSTKSRDALARRLAEVGCPSSIAVSTHHAFALSLLREAKGSWSDVVGADGGGAEAGGNKENTAAAGAAAPAKRSRFLFGLQTTVGASGATFLVPASPPSRATGS